jgi:hypothetical protein
MTPEETLPITPVHLWRRRIRNAGRLTRSTLSLTLAQKAAGEVPRGGAHRNRVTPPSV